MTVPRISFWMVLSSICITIDGRGCGSGYHVYNFIHLPDDIRRFSVNTTLDFHTAIDHVHLSFRPSISSTTFNFKIRVEKEDQNWLEFDFYEGNEKFEKTVFDGYNISILYEDKNFVIKRANGSTIFQTNNNIMANSKPRYFWYDVNIQILGCEIGLSDHCSAEYLGTTTTRPLEVKCALTECVWENDRRNGVFKKCNKNCIDSTANCTDYLTMIGFDSSVYVNTTLPTLGNTIAPSSETHMQMNTNNYPIQSHFSTNVIPKIESTEQSKTEILRQSKTTAVQNRNFATGDNRVGDSDWAEPQHTTLVNSKINTIRYSGDGDSGDYASSLRTTETSVNEMETARYLHSEYRSTSPRPTTVSDMTTTGIGVMASDFEESSDKNEPMTENEDIEAGVVTTDIGVVSEMNERPTKNVFETDDHMIPGIRWTTSIIFLIVFTVAGVSTFVIGCLCVLHGLLIQPKERLKVLPEEAVRRDMKEKN
ncbi:uncharacterized protein LOC117116914 [Anneissia japonica]|uniref:uncharacterized protein LOC117116914 n=1 Tax=Anneissia japonica TaxID=1529436 RepID=UPI0014256F17|nr:uncharacterized protein LOC117116914 [Anneissia japonica]